MNCRAPAVPYSGSGIDVLKSNIFLRRSMPDGKGRRVPVLLRKHFTGWSSMDVSQHGGALVVRGRYHGVDYHVPGVSNKMAEGLHLQAEAGRMSFPFPKGTGWVGLLRRLNASV